MRKEVLKDNIQYDYFLIKLKTTKIKKYSFLSKESKGTKNIGFMIILDKERRGWTRAGKPYGEVNIIVKVLPFLGRGRKVSIFIILF